MRVVAVVVLLPPPVVACSCRRPSAKRLPLVAMLLEAV